MHFILNSSFGDNPKYLQIEKVKNLILGGKKIKGKQEILL